MDRNEKLDSSEIDENTTENLIDAINNDDFEVVQKIVSMNNSIVHNVTDNGYSPFEEIRFKDKKYWDLFLENGAYIDTQDYSGRTLLYIAASDNLTELLTYLIENGADINLSSDEMSPLEASIEYESSEAFNILFASGADYDFNIEKYKNRQIYEQASSLIKSKKALEIVNEAMQEISFQNTNKK